MRIFKFTSVEYLRFGSKTDSYRLNDHWMYVIDVIEFNNKNMFYN